MAKAIATDPARRQGKFRRLVEDFAATLEQHGASMPLAVIEQFVADRITVVAPQVGISEQTVLRNHLSDSWGADMARRAIEDRAIDRARHRLSSDAALPLALVGALVAALGQAQLFAAVNAEDSDDLGLDEGPVETGESARVTAAWDNSMPGGPPHYSPEGAANASSGLGLALRDTAMGETVQPGQDMLMVPGSVLLDTRRALEAFEDRLRRGRWVSCRCPDCAETIGVGPDPTAIKTADRVAEDRALLARFSPPPETALAEPQFPGIGF